MQNTHDLLVGTLSISIPSKAIYYYYFTLVGYEIVIAYSALCPSLAIYHFISNAHSWNKLLFNSIVIWQPTFKISANGRFTTLLILIVLEY